MRQSNRNAVVLGLVFLATTLVVTGCDNPTSSDPTTGSGITQQFSVGDTGPAGGLIFFVDENDDHEGWRYLEAAPRNWLGEGDSETRRQWCSCSPGDLETSVAFGQGFENTEKIFSRNLNNAVVALVTAHSVTVNGVVYDDWFLPSQNELVTMYQALHRAGLGQFSSTPANTGDTGVFYWSSYIRIGSAWRVNFDLEQGETPDATAGGSLSSLFFVRPIRRF